jgi:hypothetical protein
MCLVEDTFIGVISVAGEYDPHGAVAGFQPSNLTQFGNRYQRLFRLDTRRQVLNYRREVFAGLE